MELESQRRQRVRLADRDELGRRCVEPGEQVADLGHRQVLEARVGLGVRRVLGDEELVVDVDVRRMAELLERRDRVTRHRQAEAARAAGRSRRVGRRRPRPGSRRPGRRSLPARGTERPTGTCGPWRRRPGSPHPRARVTASIVRGRSSPSAAISVRSRSTAKAETRAGKPGGRISRRSTRRRTAPRPRSAAARAGPRRTACRPAPW